VITTEADPEPEPNGDEPDNGDDDDYPPEES